MTENLQGALWLTAMGRIVLDNLSNEVFSEPYDKKIMTREELESGIKFEEFMKRITKLLLDRGESNGYKS